MESTYAKTTIQSGVPMRNIHISLVVITVLVGGLLSLFASAYPDGLEWAIAKTTGTTELEAEGSVMERAAIIQETTALMPDYNFKNTGEDGSRMGVTVAGIIGSALTFFLAGAAAFTIFVIKKKKKNNAALSV